MEVKLVISADSSALKFAELLGGIIKEGIVIESEEKLEGGAFVGTGSCGEFVTQDVKMETAPVDKPEIVEEEPKQDNIAQPQVFTAEELRAVALQVPKDPAKQNEVARILQSACAPDAKPSISNVLPENSYQTMVRLKTLAGVE